MNSNVRVGSLAKSLNMPKELHLSQKSVNKSSQNRDYFFAAPKALYRYSGGTPHKHMVILD